MPPKKQQQQQQAYIPGLTPRPADTDVPQHVAHKDTEQAKMPPKKQKQQQAYIPGLTPRPADTDVPPHVAHKTEANILVDDFLAGRKNPTMCLYEYCAQNKLSLMFKQEHVEYKTGMPSHGSVGYRALVEEQAYPQGVAVAKKDAKNEASRLAFRVLVGLDKYVPVSIKLEVDDLRFEEVRRLSDLCEQNRLYYDKIMTREQDGRFVCAVIVAEYEHFIWKSFSRDEAVVKAHETALSELTTVYQNASIITTPVLESGGARSRVPDAKMAALREIAAYQALTSSLQQLPPEFGSFDHNIAVIFISNDYCAGYEGVGKIVAFGTGNSTIEVKSLTPDGRCIVDSTCVVTARRGFKRYLAKEMLNSYDDKPSIFERRLDEPSRWRLKSGFFFHLYLSHPIDGNYNESLATPTEFTGEDLAQIQTGAHYPNFADDVYAQLMCKNERGVVTLTDQIPNQDTLNDVSSDSQLWVMSASDKLLRWNILGLQGAALTHFTDPIYLSSIAIGYNPHNDHGHLCRAVCCRVYADLEDNLPKPYTVNHPALNIVTKEIKRFQPDQTSSWDSLNWSFYDQMVELTDGISGRSHKLSPFHLPDKSSSRQCKAGHHLKWFRELCMKDGKQKVEVFANKSPFTAKSMAKTYQVAKKAFTDHCLQWGIGKWVHAPKELNMFTK